MSFYLDGCAVLGAVSDTVTDYDYGEKQVLQLVQYHDALERPLEYEAAVEAIYKSYENAKATWNDKVLKWKNATAMKQVGADAARLMAEMQASGAARGAPGTAAGTRQAAVPSGGSSAVYVPGVNENKPWTASIPWWVWGGAAVTFVGTGLYLLAPVLGAAVAARRG